MAESICRALRDGALEGEYAPALTIKDSLHSPYGAFVFNHVLSQLSSYISAGKSQSRGIVLLAFARSPSFYVELLKNRGHDMDSSYKWLRIVDCYTDPLGWKQQLMESGIITNFYAEDTLTSTLYKSTTDMNKLLTLVLKLGKEMIGQEKLRFSVAIDSVSQMLRYASLSSVAGLLNSLRSNVLVFSALWLLHSDVDKSKAITAFEYMSSMVANIEPLCQPSNEQGGNSQTLSSLEKCSGRGNFQVRFKRRNGRVRQMSEEFLIEQSGIKFTTVTSQGGISQSLVPKVQFNLQLSDKEQSDKANVVLPFEHQGHGKPIQIYDGRRALEERHPDGTPTAQKSEAEANSVSGQIIYCRDSDDETPDSDEDPDDDLDI